MAALAVLASVIELSVGSALLGVSSRNFLQEDMLSNRMLSNKVVLIYCNFMTLLFMG
jgi:hypothetical protein